MRPADLPQALASLSPDVWPYGRVVAIEESPTAPKTERVAIRRNVEATIQILNDLGWWWMNGRAPTVRCYASIRGANANGFHHPSC